ncbi:MAG: DUF1565 domain-containing protein [Candidatus Cloacimonetes bacterium]|nr:DUF1565 domain-containing protein [Candidatus Cloacimonadota bacterium]
MKLKLLFLLVLISANSWLSSTTWHIKQDGTGNFTTIQEGIDASSDSDTILVYPGTYYENIDYLEKSLTVASLYIITPADSLINQTIIDGNHEFRCVKIDECENASFIGFTIQNGFAIQEGYYEAYEGGGIFIKYTSNALIANCIIKNNKSYLGGGIYISFGNVVLKGNTISYNWGLQRGGGIFVHGVDITLQFDETNLNNIFLNYSGTGADLFISVYTDITEVIVDTFTVTEPDYFFIASYFDYTFSCLNAKIEQIDQDLFIAPNGNDSNSGLTTDDPLQTIACAQTLIKRNDENPNTIHLASGIYSPSLNNQRFPLNIKHGVKQVGISPDETILDAESESPFFFQFSSHQVEFAKLVMEDLRMINGEKLGTSLGGGINIYNADINLYNVIFENCSGLSSNAILSENGYCNLNNVIIRDNFGGRGIYLQSEYNCPNPILDVTFTNTKIQNNLPGPCPDDGSGGALHISGHFNIPGDYNAKLINCEITGNHDNFYNPLTGMGGTAGLYMKDMVLVDAVNCTFGDNTLSYDTGCAISVNNSELNLFNSILYNNDGYSFNLWEDAVVNISHSLIEGGDDNVNYYYPLAVVNWLEGNIDENPMFDSLGTYPFALLENSPCIDAGTLELPPGIELPEYDLAGNPRIVNGMIDMGAYEYQDSVSVLDNIQSSIFNTQLSNYPNPFNPSGAGRSPSTTIKLELAESGKIELAIYNVKGQKIKTLMDAYSCRGHFDIVWRGKDDNGKKVASGNYFIKLKVNGEEKAVRKCILLK